MSKYNTKVQRGEYSLDGAESARFLVLFLTVWLAVRVVSIWVERVGQRCSWRETLRADRQRSGGVYQVPSSRWNWM
jgi:hypothetical protein